MRKKERAMRKWKIWLPIVLIILAIAGGSFAYTYLTATQTISVSGTGGDIAIVEPDGSPSWPDISGRQAGQLPTVSLFTINPKGDYTGNLLVKLYLTNTGELIHVYQHLNMKIGLFNGSGGQVGRTEYLTLDNGVATIETDYGIGWVGVHKLKVTGGSYNTLKGVAGSGESFAPAFYAEVRQK